MTMDHAQRLAKQANAQVITIDWGSSKLSCCSYPMLVYCYMDIISEWMAKVIQTCSTIAPSTSISNTWLIGHSLGAQLSGYTAKNLQTETTKVRKLIGLDPAGPLFGDNYILPRKCHGIQREYADDTMVFMSNPGVLGTRNNSLAAVNVYINQENDFCQLGCECNDISCKHRYAYKFLKLLADHEEIHGTKLDDENPDSMYSVTMYEKMQPGLYDIESDNNAALENVESNLIF